MLAAKHHNRVGTSRAVGCICAIIVNQSAARVRGIRASPIVEQKVEAGHIGAGESWNGGVAAEREATHSKCAGVREVTVTAEVACTHLKEQLAAEGVGGHGVVDTSLVLVHAAVIFGRSVHYAKRSVASGIGSAASSFCRAHIVGAIFPYR